MVAYNHVTSILFPGVLGNEDKLPKCTEELLTLTLDETFVSKFLTEDKEFFAADFNGTIVSAKKILMYRTSLF